MKLFYRLGMPLATFGPSFGIAIFCLASALAGTVRAQAGQPAEPSVQVADHIFQFRNLAAEHVLVIERGGYWPSAALLQNGDLIVIARAGARHEVTRGGSYLELVRSRDFGRTWSEPVWVAASQPDEDLRDGFVTELRDGTLALAFHIYRFGSGTEYDGNHVPAYVSLSSDHGRTWGIPGKVDVSPYTFASPHRRIVELPDGTLLMATTVGYTQTPSWGSIFRPAGEREFESSVVRSHDGGKTWGDLTVIDYGDETSLLRLRSGTLLAAVRGGPVPGGFRAISIHQSTDDGRTWRNLGRATEPSQLPGSLLLLRDGRVLLSYGDRRGPFYGVQAMLSRDSGQTWDRDHLQLAWDAPNWDCGYPDSIQLPDGRIFTVYYQVDDRSKAPDTTKAKGVIWQVPE